jgi:hypothetical protein
LCESSNSDFKKTYGAGRRLIAKSAGVDGLVSIKEISFHAQGCTAALGVTVEGLVPMKVSPSMPKAAPQPWESFLSAEKMGSPSPLPFIHKYD